MVEPPAAAKITTPTTIAVFAFDHAIIFNAPFTRVEVEGVAAAPFTIATAATDFASATGAACTEFAEIALARVAVVEVTPRLAQNFSNLAIVRSTRFPAPHS